MAKYTASEQREFFEAERSVAEAILHLADRSFRLTSALKNYLRSPVKFDYELAKKKALVFLRCAKDLKRQGMIVFKNPNLRHALNEALKRDDLDFFKSVGRVLSGKQVSWAELEDEAFLEGKKLENFLIRYWTDELNGMKPLCFLSMKELANACHKYGGAHSSIDEKAIHNIWTQLGLRRVKGFKYRGPGLNKVTAS